MWEDPGQDTRLRLSVAEAADALGITVDAVRSRVKRRTIDHVRVGGRVYVLLGDDKLRPGRDQHTHQVGDQRTRAPEDRTAELIATLREQLQAERQAHAEARRLLAAALERIPPQLEAPSDARESDVSPEPTGELGELREELDTERTRRERAESTLREGMDEERRRREEAEREREDLRRELYARREPRESPQTVEEEPERAEPCPATGGAQEGTERPQQRSGWLAPVDKLPWWQYLLGLGLIGLEVSILGLAFAFPATFGFWVGFKRRNLSLWRNLVPMGLIAGAIGPGMIFAVRTGLWTQSFLFLGKLSLVDVLFVMFVLFIPALFFISGAIIGRALQRRTAGAYASLTPDIEDPSSAPRPTTPGDGWSPRKQAILGFAGTLIAALLSLIATFVSTIMASGG